MGCGALPHTLYKPLLRSFDYLRVDSQIDGVILASLCLFAHNNTRPQMGKGREGDNGGRGGGTDFPGPSPLCALGDKGGRVLPLAPPECKQQQMNKNKNTKGQRKLPGMPPSLGSLLSPLEVSSLPPPPQLPPSQGCLALATSQGKSRAQNCWASSSHK